MATQPATKAFELFNKIVKNFNTLDQPLSEFEIKRFEKALDNIKKTASGSSAYHAAKSMISLAKGDIKEFHRNGQLSIKLNPDESVFLTNYAASLYCIGLFDEARVCQEKAAMMTSYSSPEILEELIFIYYLLGKIEQVISVYHKLLKLKPENLDSPACILAKTLEDFLSILDDDEERKEVKNNLSIALTVAVKHIHDRGFFGKVPSPLTVYNCIREDECYFSWLTTTLKLKGESQKVIETELDLSEKYAEFDECLGDRIHVSFI